MVDGELTEVHEVDAEALGDHARQLVGAQDAAIDEHGARVAPAGAGFGDGGVDRVAVGKAEVDDDLADEARRAAPAGRREQPWARGGGRLFGDRRLGGYGRG